MNKEEYLAFYNALISAESAPLKEFDKRDFKVYEGCMPVEVMAQRGEGTLRFGPMKPVGLVNPKTGHRPWAVLQLRKENKACNMYNLVGFQTNLKFPEQKRVFSLIPALHNADFVRYGVMHRNTYINSTKLLNNAYNLKKNSNIFFAGQITGVEGYVESISSGLVAGLNAINKFKGNNEKVIFGQLTMIGALAKYISTENEKFQPMNANFGILPPLEEKIRDKKLRYEKLSDRAINEITKTK